MLDLGCGVGGLSLGFREAGFAVAGIDSNPDPLVFYKHYVGPAVEQSVETYRDTHPASVVVADLGAGEIEDSPVLQNMARIIELTGAHFSIVTIPTTSITLGGMSERIEARLGAHTKLVHLSAFDVGQFGAAYSGHRLVVVGCRTYKLWEKFTWGVESRGGPRRSVAEALDLPYPGQCQKPTSTEHKSAPRGMRGGKGSVQSATEDIAETVGWSLFREMTGGPVLRARHLARLAGLPEAWEFHPTSAREASLIARAFPPGLAGYLARRTMKALAGAGLTFAPMKSV